MLFQSHSQEQLRAEDFLNGESCVDKKDFDPLFVNAIDTFSGIRLTAVVWLSLNIKCVFLHLPRSYTDGNFTNLLMIPLTDVSPLERY